jgi:Flp pilus assembly protein TadD
VKLPRVVKSASTVLAAAALTAAIGCRRAAPTVSPAREDAYRANNRGVALLEQFNPTAAADAFREARRIHPQLTLSRINLAIALVYVPDIEAAEREATEAARELPRDPHAPYVLGLVERARGRDEQARAAFQRVLELDPTDVGTHINLGQLDLQRQQYDEAMKHFRAALAEEPYSVTAAYGLGLALTRAGRRDEGRQAIERSQALRAGGYGTIMSTNYLEQGQYAVALASGGAEPELVDRAVPDVTFTRLAIAEPIGESAAGGVTLLDFDGDGDLDVCAVSAGGVRLFRNDRGAFVDVTAASGLAAAPGGIGVVAGDYDNDGLPDLLVLRRGGAALYHNDGSGRFSDASRRAELPQYPSTAETAAFADVDHDGDLDLVVGGPDGLVQLVRNNGNNTFTDITAQAGMGGTPEAVAIVPTDFDNRRDIDLLIVKRDGSPALFSNLRDGTFRDVAAEAGIRIDGRLTSVAAADVNKDEFPDFFFGRAGAAGVLALSTGRGRFRIVDAPGGSADARAAQFLDYDNDGLFDLLTWASDGPHVFRNVGDSWTDVTSRAFPQTEGARAFQASRRSDVSSARALVTGDVDGDGDTDIIVAGEGGRLELWRNDGGSARGSVSVRLAGRASNRAGVAAKIDLRAGSLRQRIETSSATPAMASADVLFGLGSRARADVVRVLWPSGILQAETSVRSPIAIRELDRKPSSCPFLYTWNGTRFEFVTDFMGGGEMGYWEAPGIRNTPDPDEYVRIRGDQLRPRDGAYELRVTNELEETLFVDRLQLLAVTHPTDVEIFPNEGMTDPPKPFRLYGAVDLRPPLRAVDEHGYDVTARIATRDREYPDDFELLAFRGYAGPHTLTLTLPRLAAPPLLLLTGWTDYAFSSDNVAAQQAGLVLEPPRLELGDGRGGWQTLIADIGIPVGRPQTIVVDLDRRLPPASGPIDLRIVTNMRIYWDQIQVGTRADMHNIRVDRMDPATARLQWRGFSFEVSPDGRQPTVFDYDRVTVDTPWKTPPGQYTREGDVRPLLMRVDDKFAIARPGDEIALSFDGTRTGAVPAGMTRTFLLFADGFSKEMDINSALPDRVEPMPFHAMTRYPYGPHERYPDTAGLRRYQREYNTRVVAAPLPPLDLLGVRAEARPRTR